jgi:hypothetical protein
VGVHEPMHDSPRKLRKRRYRSVFFRLQNQGKVP